MDIHKLTRKIIVQKHVNLMEGLVNVSAVEWEG